MQKNSLYGLYTYRRAPVKAFHPAISGDYRGNGAPAISLHTGLAACATGYAFASVLCILAQGLLKAQNGWRSVPGYERPFVVSHEA